jgi:lipid A 3-O-deacylase
LKVITTIFALFGALISLAVRGQNIDSTQKYKGYFHYMYENDLFTGTDRYYTQGSVVEFMHPSLERSPISKLLIKIYHPQDVDHFIYFRQDVFTPKSILNKTLDSTDRPYAGSFYFTQKAVSKNHFANLTTSLDIGILGPAALGEQMQKFIHAHTRNAEPIGWENQVANTPIINYDLWYERALIIPRGFELMFQAGGKAGMLYTNAEAGLKIRFGKMNPYFLKLKPTQQAKWELFATASGTARYVQYNAVIEGVPWAKSIHVLTADKIERMVYKLDFSVNFFYKRLGLAYTSSFITPEFKGGLPHGWGGCNVYYRF